MPGVGIGEVPMSFRVPHEIKAGLRVLADRSDRSMNAVVVNLVRREMERKGVKVRTGECRDQGGPDEII